MVFYNNSLYKFIKSIFELSFAVNLKSLSIIGSTVRDCFQRIYETYTRRGEIHLPRHGTQIVSDPPPRLSTKNCCNGALNVFR